MRFEPVGPHLHPVPTVMKERRLRGREGLFDRRESGPLRAQRAHTKPRFRKPFRDRWPGLAGGLRVALRIEHHPCAPSLRRSARLRRTWHVETIRENAAPQRLGGFAGHRAPGRESNAPRPLERAGEERSGLFPEGGRGRIPALRGQLGGAVGLYREQGPTAARAVRRQHHLAFADRRQGPLARHVGFAMEPCLAHACPIEEAYRGRVARQAATREGGGLARERLPLSAGGAHGGVDGEGDARLAHLRVQRHEGVAPFAEGYAVRPRLQASICVDVRCACVLVAAQREERIGAPEGALDGHVGQVVAPRVGRERVEQDQSPAGAPVPQGDHRLEPLPPPGEASVPFRDDRASPLERRTGRVTVAQPGIAKGEVGERFRVDSRAPGELLFQQLCAYHPRDPEIRCLLEPADCLLHRFVPASRDESHPAAVRAAADSVTRAVPSVVELRFSPEQPVRVVGSPELCEDDGVHVYRLSLPRHEREPLGPLLRRDEEAESLR